MEQAQSQKQPPIISIHRKPFSDLTNRRHATSFSQSKKRTPSTIAAISDSSTRSTQNPNRLTPYTPITDDWVGDRNRIAHSRRNTMLKTRNKQNTVATVPVYPALLEKTENETKKSKNIMEEAACTPLSGAKPIVDGEEKTLQSNSSTKRRKCSSSAESCRTYVVPQDFIDQQRAYYEEIDGYELEVEEFECESEDEE